MLRLVWNPCSTHLDGMRLILSPPAHARPSMIYLVCVPWSLLGGSVAIGRIRWLLLGSYPRKEMPCFGRQRSRRFPFSIASKFRGGIFDGIGHKHATWYNIGCGVAHDLALSFHSQAAYTSPSGLGQVHVRNSILTTVRFLLGLPL